MTNNIKSGLEYEHLAARIYQREYENLPYEFRRTVDRFDAKAKEITRKRSLLQETTAQHPDNGGREGELIWAEFIREIIPDEFKVVRNVRIVDANPEQSPELDIVILKPGAEKKLDPLGYYPRHSLIAAFECKLSLETKHIETAARQAPWIKEEANASFLKLEDVNKRRIPIYGLLGTGLKKGLTWDGQTLSDKALDACAKCEGYSSLDFILVNDVSFVTFEYQRNPFDENEMLHMARHDNSFKNRIVPSHVPLIGFALFLVRAIADFKEEYSHLIRDYNFYDAGPFTSSTRTLQDK